MHETCFLIVALPIAMRLTDEKGEGAWRIILKPFSKDLKNITVIFSIRIK